MKKVFLTFAVFMAALSAFSENVTVQTAQQAAQSFLNSKMEGNQQIHLIDFAEKSEFPNFYVFGNEHCFVIIAGDDGAKPVLGYSTEGGFNSELIPDNVKDWLKCNNDEITSAMNLRVEATPRIRSEWESLLSGRGLEPRSSSAVNPLITTHWHQYAPYNNLCPADPNASTGHAKAGCGAIAMAQFMNYWEHPINGVGEHSYTPSNHPEYGVQYVNFGETEYDWDNMRDDYSSGYNDTEALAVATLVYHCGVSVNMNYGPSGSACNSSVIDDALMTFFDYSPNTEYIFKETSTDTISDETWIAMLKFNLDMQWPLIYRGQTEFAEGHIFICDGYDNNDYFHINWGHGGGADGYFAIGSLYENWTDYSYNNAAIFYSIPNYLYNAYNGNDPLIYSFNFVCESVTLKVKGHVDGEDATGTLTIPETKTFNGVTLAVTAIGNSAFRNCSGFTGNLVIPNSVTTIGNSAFRNCSGFTGSLIIPTSVTTIETSAFEDCSGFAGSLTIGNSVISIGNRAFDNCSGFTSVYYTGGLDQWCDISFFGNPLSQIHNLYIDNELVTNLIIPDGVVEIKANAFMGATCLTSLTIPNTVVTIGSSAFEWCTGLTGSLTIPNSVTSIGMCAFFGCSGFTGNLTIGNSVTTIGRLAFMYCNGFTGSLTIPNSVTSIGDRAFEECSSLTGNLTISNSVTTIEERAFYGCRGLAGELIMGNSVTTIGESAFEDCRSFTGSLIIPNSVTTICNNAFAHCKGFIGGLIIGNSVRTIGNDAFWDCSGLTSVIIGDSVSTIGSYAFDECISLASIHTFAETAPNLEYKTFNNVNHDIPVIVPCGSLSSYQNASGWNEFTNIQEDCTSLSEEMEVDVHVFPNPANDFLTITGEGICRVMVFDATGQMIEDRKIGKQDFVQIDVKDYAIGAFVVKIFIGDGVAVKQFMKY